MTPRRRTVARAATVALSALLLLPLVSCDDRAPAVDGGDVPVPTSLTAPAAPNPDSSTAPAASPELVPTSTTSTPSVRPARPARPVRPGRDTRPNIVFISTDDQADYDLRWMPHTRKLLAREGVTFTDSIAPHPLCCPARAIMLTGQYAQNNGVRHNEGIYGGYKRLDPDHTVATWLSSAGYQTAFVGKYLNGYEHKPRDPEPGWDIWNPTIKGVYGFYNYTMYNNGRPKRYTDLHNADLVGLKTAGYIKQFSRSNKPFFIWASQVAPHGACVPSEEHACWVPPVPAKRHAKLFRGVQPVSMRDPAYNEADVSDKPQYIQDKAPVKAKNIRKYFRPRIQSLQAVDEAVKRTVDTLKKVGELRSTMIVFTSDNGYLLGEHRRTTKNIGYEEALQVPLIIRGPGIPHGVKRTTQVAAVDLTPTFLAAAQAKADVTVDGLNLLPDARHGTANTRDTVLLQSGPMSEADDPFGWFYRGVRTARYTYLYYPATAESELYDRSVDPDQLDNLSGNRRYRAIEAELAQRVDSLGTCNGVTCRVPFGRLPAPLARLR